MSIQDIGPNLRRLMKLKGYTIAKLAKEMEVGTATISNILNGRSEPQSSTLIKFGNALGVSLNEILSDAPKLKSLRFRTNKTLSAREKAERDQMLYKTAQWLKNYHDLEKMLDEKRNDLFENLEMTTPEETAREVRKKLGLLKDQPLYDLPAEIEKAGIKLYLHHFGFKKTFGLSVSDRDLGPAIVINAEKDVSIERRIFTIAHELGHLLMHPGSYDSIESIEEGSDEQEKEADRFAGEFLLPTVALKKEWNEAEGLHWVDRVLKIKKMYRVSYKTVLIRLSQIFPHYDPGTIYRKFSMAYKEKYHHDLKNYYEPESLTSYDLLEDHFAGLVRKAYFSDRISITKAGEILEKSVSEMRKLIVAWRELELDEET